ncbi:MAG: hypothetical protein NVSMB33_08230 [Ktedonobacteraceae bacterium]
MTMTYFPSFRYRQAVSKRILITTLALLLTLVLSACNGDPQAQQQAAVQKSHLNTLLSNARAMGVPNSMLLPILKQEQDIQNTSAPSTILNDQPATDYYNNLTQRYRQLAIEVTGLETKVTQQFDYQAYLDIQNLENILAERQAQNFIEAKTFANQLAQDQSLLAKARYPKDYLQISSSARRSSQALHLMGPAYSQLQSLQQFTQQFEASHMDTTALTQEAQDDLNLFRGAAQPEDFTSLLDQLGAQLQEANVLSFQAIPYIGAYEGANKLQKLKANINEAKKYGENIATFQQRFNVDQMHLSAANANQYASILSQIDNDIASMQIPLIRGKANYFLKQYNAEVQAWGNAHQQLNSFDNHAYRLDYEYDTQEGIGQDAAAAVQTAQTTDDYQAAITLIKNDLFHLKAMEVDYHDGSPWYQAHRADAGLLKYYNLKGGLVIVVSLVEQVLRFYQNGRLVRAFQITSGQYARPTPPGLWNIFLRQHPTEFKSSEPKGSAFWYPPTPIQYAMEYHDGGYFLHDSWWRADYGFGTNFPHYDSGGDEAFAGNGSHGCINMAPNDVAWLYQHTSYGVPVIVC